MGEKRKLADAWLMIGTWTIVAAGVAFSMAPVLW